MDEIDNGITNVESPVVQDNNNTVVEQPKGKEYNFEMLRQLKDEESRMRIAAERRNAELEQQLKGYNSKETEIQDDDLDFGDAIDSDSLKKITKFIAKRDKQWEEKFNSIEAEKHVNKLSSKDPDYIKVINDYLPDVIVDDPSIKDIIANTPAHKQWDVMYRFATSNQKYVIDKHINKAKKDNRIEDNPQKINSLGAVSQGRSTSNGKINALTMSHDDFYGDYLQKVLDGRIK